MPLAPKGDVGPPSAQTEFAEPGTFGLAELPPSVGLGALDPSPAFPAAVSPSSVGLHPTASCPLGLALLNCSLSEGALVD